MMMTNTNNETRCIERDRETRPKGGRDTRETEIGESKRQGKPSTCGTQGSRQRAVWCTEHT